MYFGQGVLCLLREAITAHKESNINTPIPMNSRDALCVGRDMVSLGRKPGRRVRGYAGLICRLPVRASGPGLRWAHPGQA